MYSVSDLSCAGPRLISGGGARRVAVKCLRDLADDLAHISPVAGPLCVYHARY